MKENQYDKREINQDNELDLNQPVASSSSNSDDFNFEDANNISL